MFSTIASAISLLLVSQIMMTASALLAPAFEPSIVTKVAVFTSIRFEIAAPHASSSPAHIARQWDWALPAPVSPPAVPAWTPAPQPSWAPSPVETILMTPTPTWSLSPTPSYSWEETHDDHKNTLTHEIIAAIVVGSFVGLPIIGCIIFCIYRNCRGNKIKNQVRAEDIEHAKMATRPGSDRASDVTSLEGPAMEMRQFGRHIVHEHGVTIDRIEPGERVDWSRDGGLRQT